MISNIQLSTTEFVKRLTIHKSCAETALQDMQDSRTCYVCFDHSLLAPWLHQGSPSNQFRILGNNLFRLYQRYGRISPYRLTINYPTLRETQDQLVHACEDMERLSSSMDGLSGPHLIKTNEVEKVIGQYKGHLSRATVNLGHFRTFQRLIRDGNILGNFDTLPIRNIGNLFKKDHIEEFKSVLLQAREYRQKDRFDRMFHAECDAIRPTDVISINREFASVKYVYSGSATVSMLLGSLRHEYSRHPLTILTALYALRMSEDQPDHYKEAISWLKAKQAAIEKCLNMVYKRGVARYDELNLVDRQKVDVVEALYVVPLYDLSEKEVPETPERREIMEYVNTPKEIKDQAEKVVASTREAASNFSDAITNEDDEAIYASIEDKLSLEARARIDQIVNRIKGPR